MPIFCMLISIFFRCFQEKKIHFLLIVDHFLHSDISEFCNRQRNCNLHSASKRTQDEFFIDQLAVIPAYSYFLNNNWIDFFYKSLILYLNRMLFANVWIFGNSQSLMHRLLHSRAALRQLEKK